MALQHQHRCALPEHDASQFTGNVNQVSHQINAVVMAAARARSASSPCIDEKPETDDGYVTLVNAEDHARRHRDRMPTARTGHWAWKHPASATAPSPTPSCAATCASTTWTSPTRADKDRAARHLPVRQAGPEGRLRRRDRRGQDHHHEPHQPLLRHCRRQDPLRRHQHQQDQEGGPAPLPRASCLQDTNLFTGTVMENIRYGNLDATDEECIAAAKLAGADDFITPPAARATTRMLTGNGANLSPGPAPAARHRPRGGRRSAGDDPRRGDQLHRHAHRGHRAARHGRADGRAARCSSSPTASPPSRTPTPSWCWTTAASSSAAATKS